ncbi:hypothetical protein MMC13_000875 [Lambiella insularis]|nr:hypothetical protein [Lambiella insularis]
MIRVSPNQVVFNNPEAIPDIYGHQHVRKYEEDPFYDHLSSGSYHDIVTVRDHGENSLERRYLTNSFALKTVVEMEDVIRKNFRDRLDSIDGAAEVGRDSHAFLNHATFVHFECVDLRRPKREI